MLKPTLASLIALSLGFAALACEPAEEPPAEDQEPVPDTTAPPDSLVETIGGNWIVRAQSGKACVSVPPSAVAGRTLDVQVKRVARPPVPPKVSEIYPPVYDFSVTENGLPAEFADDVVFAICVNFPGSQEPDTVAMARLVSPDSVEILEQATVPLECRLTCRPMPEATSSSAWLEHLFGGSPITPTPAYAVERGLGGKGRGTSPFAGVSPTLEP